MRGKHDTMTSGEAKISRAGDATFLGHPKGLFYLAFTEAWERFSFYGMTALVVLYMVNQLLLPGHVEHIGGFAGFRAALETLFGPLSTQALASQIFGLYSGFVYFTPLPGVIQSSPAGRLGSRLRPGRATPWRAATESNSLFQFPLPLYVAAVFRLIHQRTDVFVEIVWHGHTG